MDNPNEELIPGQEAPAPAAEPAEAVTEGEEAPAVEAHAEGDDSE